MQPPIPDKEASFLRRGFLAGWAAATEEDGDSALGAEYFDAWLAAENARRTAQLPFAKRVVKLPPLIKDANRFGVSDET